MWYILWVITYHPIIGIAQIIYRWRNYVSNSHAIFTPTDIIMIDLSLKMYNTNKGKLGGTCV
jgi:hypothetical protein